MKLIKIFLIIIFLNILFLSLGYAVEKKVEIEELDLLIEEALDYNPKLQSAYAKWKEGVHKSKRITSFPNPKASYTIFGDNIETRVGPQQKKYGVSQKIPFPAKLVVKGRTYSKKANILEEKYEALGQEIIKNVRFIYLDIFWVDKAIQTTKEERILLESFERVVRRKYETNIKHQNDVIKTQTEISKLIDNLYLLKKHRKTLVEKMNKLLNRHHGTKFGKTQDIKPVELKYNLEELHKIADYFSKELAIATLNIKKAAHEKTQAKLDYFPDFSFGMNYIQIGSGSTTMPSDGKDAWMVNIGVSVPLWFNELSANLKEKRESLKASKSSYINVKNILEEQVEDLYSRCIKYKDVISLYKTSLIPKAIQDFEISKIAYATGKTDYLNRINSIRTILRKRLAYYKAIVDYQKSFAYLERIVGKDLIF